MYTQHQPATRPRARQRWRNGLIALLVIGALLLTTSAALAQTSTHFQLGCWSITSGGGAQRSGTAFRSVDAMNYVGGQMQSSQFRIQANHLVLYGAYRTTAVTAPVPKASDTFMPVITKVFRLQNLCR